MQRYWMALIIKLVKSDDILMENVLNNLDSFYLYNFCSLNFKDYLLYKHGLTVFSLWVL